LEKEKATNTENQSKHPNVLVDDNMWWSGGKDDDNRTEHVEKKQVKGRKNGFSDCAEVKKEKFPTEMESPLGLKKTLYLGIGGDYWNYYNKPGGEIYLMEVSSSERVLGNGHKELKKLKRIYWVSPTVIRQKMKQSLEGEELPMKHQTNEEEGKGLPVANRGEKKLRQDDFAPMGKKEEAEPLVLEDTDNRLGSADCKGSNERKTGHSSAH